MQEKRGPVTLWIDRLTLGSAIRLARLHRGLAITRIHYLKATGVGLALVRTMRWLRLLPAELNPIAYSLGDFRDPGGRALRYLVEEESLRLMDAVAQEWCSPRAEFSPLVADLPRGKVFLYLYKAFAARTYPAVLLVQLALHAHRNDRQAVPSILVSERWIAALLMRLGLAVEYPDIPPPDQRRSAVGWGGRLPFVLQAVGIVAANLMRMVVPGSVGTGRSQAGVIMSQFCHGLDPRYRTDLFWLPSAGVEPGHVLFYFDRDVCVPDPGVRAELERQGLNWIALPSFSLRNVFRALATCRTLPRFPGCRWLGQTGWLRQAVTLLRHSHPLVLWQGAELIKLRSTAAWWKAVFEGYHATAHLHIEDVGYSMVIRSIAMDMADGISVGYQWSHLYMMTSDHQQDQTVYFSWGPYYEAFLRRPPAQIQQLLYCGYHNWSRDLMSRDWAKDVRQSLLSRGVRYVICLFDTAFASDALANDVHTSRTAFLGLFRALLRKVMDDPTLGLIIKPRDPDSLDRLPEVRNVLERLIRDGRCVVLAWKTVPADAALAADMTIGMGLNSAVIQSAVIAGKAGLHWDYANKTDDRLHQLGRGRFVFDDLEALLEALEAHRAGKRQDIGDHSAVLAAIDPFRDGQGAFRVGSFLGWYYQARIRGHTRDIALKEATRRYLENWGKAAIAIDPVNTLGRGYPC